MLREDAIAALWVTVNNGDWCAASFPPASLNVPTWRNNTGLWGPMDLDVWEARLDRACAIGDDDLEAWRRMAAEFLEADGGDPSDPSRLGGAVDALQLMLLQTVVGLGADGEPSPELMRNIHECA